MHEGRDGVEYVATRVTDRSVTLFKTQEFFFNELRHRRTLHIGTKDNSCVEVCPVDGIYLCTPDEPDYESAEMLFIDPERAASTATLALEACPVDACFAEDQLPPEWASFTEKNAAYFKNN